MDFADCDANRQQILSLGGTAEITEWKPIKTEIMDKEHDQISGDIAGFMSCEFFLTERAMNILVPFIGDFAEFFPVDSPTDHRYLLHITKVPDVFDVENAEASYFHAEKKKIIL